MLRRDTATGVIHRPAVTYPLGGGARGQLIRGQNDWASWVPTNATVTANATANPFGVSNAAQLTEDTNTAVHQVANSSTYTFQVVNGTWYCFTVWGKANSRSKISLTPAAAVFGSTACRSWYDLSGGTVGGVQAGAIARIQAGASGWYLCQLACRATATGTASLAVALGSAGGFLESYLGDGASNAYVYLAQCGTVNPSFPFSI